MSQENLKFQITLSSTHWGKLPQFSICVDDNTAIEYNQSADGNYCIQWTQEVEEGPHELKIRLENKEPGDTVVEGGNIVKDMLLNINDIQIDDISLGPLLWTANYIFDKPQEYQGKVVSQLDQCVNLGVNGTYILKFSSPFYIWLLENL